MEVKLFRDFVPNDLNRVLYWSPLEIYMNCPQQYLWRYGWHTIDLGMGLGKPKAAPLLESRENSIMGTVIQYAIEKMYNDKMYLDPQDLLPKLYAIANQHLIKQISRQYVDWSKSPSKEEMRLTIEEGIKGYLRTMSRNKLLGEYAQCEVDLNAWVTPEIAVGGKADLIIHRQGKILIFDGKNSQSRGKYTNPDQLRWYGFVHYLMHGTIPDYLAFIYYRYPAGTLEDGKELTGLDEVLFVKDDISRLSDMVLQSRKGMATDQWQATPVPKNCQFCIYETVCDERQTQRQANAAKRTKKTPELVPGGVMDISFGD